MTSSRPSSPFHRVAISHSTLVVEGVPAADGVSSSLSRTQNPLGSSSQYDPNPSATQSRCQGPYSTQAPVKRWRKGQKAPGKNLNALGERRLSSRAGSTNSSPVPEQTQSVADGPVAGLGSRPCDEASPAVSPVTTAEIQGAAGTTASVGADTAAVPPPLLSAPPAPALNLRSSSSTIFASIPVTLEQLPVICTRMLDIQQSSGALLAYIAVAPRLFHMQVRGSAAAVQKAADALRSALDTETPNTRTASVDLSEERGIGSLAQSMSDIHVTLPGDALSDEDQAFEVISDSVGDAAALVTVGGAGPGASSWEHHVDSGQVTSPEPPQDAAARSFGQS